MDWSGNPLGPDSMAALKFLQGSNCVAHLDLSNCQLMLETVSDMTSSLIITYAILGIGNIATRLLSAFVLS